MHEKIVGAVCGTNLSLLQLFHGRSPQCRDFIVGGLPPVIIAATPVCGRQAVSCGVVPKGRTPGLAGADVFDCYMGDFSYDLASSAANLDDR